MLLFILHYKQLVQEHNGFDCDTQHNEIQHNVLLSAAFLYSYVECHCVLPIILLYFIRDHLVFSNWQCRPSALVV
jgi:hypothetical protein